MLDDLVLGRHGFDEAVGGVLRVAGHEAEDEIPVQRADAVHELGNIDAPVIVRPAVIGIDVLPEEGDVLRAVCNEGFRFVEDGVCRAASLPSADVGNDAVRAEIVAAVHDGEPCHVLRFAADRDALADLPLVAQHKRALSAVQSGVEQTGNAIDGSGVESEGDIGIAPPQLVRACLLGDHAPTDADDHLSLICL